MAEGASLFRPTVPFEPGFHGARKQFFFEKKNQKTFESGAEPFQRGQSQTAKSFLLLFFKKEDSSS
jgi:hypothetical protein